MGKKSDEKGTPARWHGLATNMVAGTGSALVGDVLSSSLAQSLQEGATPTKVNLKGLAREIGTDIPQFVNIAGTPFEAAGGMALSPDYEGVKSNIDNISNELSAFSGKPKERFVTAISPGGKGIIIVPTRGAEITAHELGHLKKPGVIGGAIRSLSNYKWLPAAGGLGGLVAALAPSDPDSSIASWAPAIPLASHIPTLLEEARASYHGMSGLKKMKLSPEMLSQARRTLLKGLGSYGTLAAFSMLPAAATVLARRHWGKKPESDAPVEEDGLKTATVRLLMKFAGELDIDALNRLEQSIRAGDILQFNAQGADVARGSIRQGLSHQLLSTPIQKATGSPDHHTAVYVGKDPKTGKMMLVHNFEQSGKSGLTMEPVDKYGKTVKLTAYRPHGVTPEQALAAAEDAKAMAAGGQTSYSKRNLVGAGLQTAGEKVEGRAGAALKRVGSQVVGKACKPGTGICSHLPVDVYGKQLGQERALEMFAGKKVPLEMGHTSVTPASISGSKAMQRVGEYSPRNLETSMRSAMGARAREKATSLLPKLKSGLKMLSRGRL